MGVNYPKIMGAREYHLWKISHKTWIILVTNAGCLLFILFSSSWINYLNPIYLGHKGLKCLVCVSKLTPCCL